MAGKKPGPSGTGKSGGNEDQLAQSELWQEISIVKENIARLPELERNMALLMAKMESLTDAIHSEPPRQWDKGKQKIDDVPLGHSCCHDEASQPRTGHEWGKEECLGHRIEMPVFFGGDPDDWIFRVERFFAFQALSEQEKLHWVAVHMEGEALAWFQWEERRRPFRSWNDVRALLLERFRSSLEGTLTEKFLQVRQSGSVRDYRQLFERAASHLSDLPEHLSEAQFMTGLRSEVRAELLVLRPAGLDQMMLLAQRVEDKFAVLQQPGLGPGETGVGPSKLGRATQSSTIFTARHSSASQARTVPPSIASHQSLHSRTTLIPSHRSASSFRRLMDSELLAKREKGLCYRCDERFFPGHRCKSKDLLVLVCQEVDSGEERPATPEEGIDEAMTQLDSTELAQISLNSLVGLFSPDSMKVRGSICGHSVVVLIDSGATHNFISHSVINKLRIPVEDHDQFEVTTGTGLAIRSKGICRALQISFPELVITENFFPLELGSADVILGFKWLKAQDEMRIHWGTLTMIFSVRGKQVTLHGDPSLGKSLISFCSLVKEFGPGDTGLLLGLQGQVAELSSKPPPEVEDILHSFQDLFNTPQGLPPSRSLDHQIILAPGTPPVCIRPYRYPHFQKDEIEKLVGEMLAAGIIQPSNSPFSSPVILVKKKNGSWRFCVDYRALNKVTIPNKFPIPRVDELLDELTGASIFSKLDLTSGYHQLRVRPEDVPKTAFRMHEGHYEFLVMPFGLTNAPSTFQALMNQIFKSFLRHYVLVFFDDILIYSSDFTEHLHHLKVVLTVLREHKLYANRSKCFFALPQLEYLGHIISANGVAVDISKVETMLSWPIPRTLKDLRGFLGLTGYYRRFVSGYGHLAAPLTSLLKKDAFLWSEVAHTAFQQLKTAMTSVPVLALPDFSKPFVLETDASGTRIGAVLMQGGRVIAFFSQALSRRAQFESVYERELRAIVSAIINWRPYLLGHRFIVRTDQRSLKYLLEQRLINSEHQKWLTKIMGYNFEIQYRAGLENKAADALSRRPHIPTFAALSFTTILPWQDISAEILADKDLSIIFEQLQHNTRAPTGYSLRNGRLYFNGRLVLTSNSVLIPRLLQEFHGSALGGHSGGFKTYQRLAAEFFWKGLRTHVKQFVAACDVCQRHKYQALSPAGLLQPLPIPVAIWEDISMDFIEGLPRSDGFNAILVVVDRLSKYAHFIALKHPFTAQSVAMAFIKDIVRLHGFPRSIVSDRDKVFLSIFWKELFKLHGTVLKHSSAYHPQTDSQTEVVNRSLEIYLRCFTSDKPRSWVQWLAWAEFWYNTSFHTAIKMSPFKAVYGREPPPLTRVGTGTAIVQSIDDLLQERDSIVTTLQTHLAQAQAKMKEIADGKRRDVNFNAGDWVFVKLQPYRQRSLATKRNEKLSPRFYGPFQVLKPVGKVAYKLKLPDTATIHNVFHVSQLRQAIGTALKHTNLPSTLSSDMELHVEPAGVLSTRLSVDGIPHRGEVLIQWKGLPEEEATWEFFDVINSQFPHFHLEDKVKVWAAGIDRKPPIQFTYSRRQRGVQELPNEWAA